jgi:hypothetical protein
LPPSPAAPSPPSPAPASLPPPTPASLPPTPPPPTVPTPPPPPPAASPPVDTPLPWASCSEAELRGDLNGANGFTLGDAVFVAEQWAGSEPPTACMGGGDYSGSNGFTIGDAVHVAAIWAGQYTWPWDEWNDGQQAAERRPGAVAAEGGLRDSERRRTQAAGEHRARGDT